MRHFLTFLAVFFPAMVLANAGITVQSSVFIERLVKAPDGKKFVKLEEPERVLPGDRLVFIVAFENHGSRPATNFFVTNPIPRAVVFQGTSEPNAQFSVNNGQSWGKISALKVADADGTRRSARVEDVTHIRWPMTRAMAVGEARKLSFRGIVR